jgi:hypothetical protein
MPGPHSEWVIRAGDPVGLSDHPPSSIAQAGDDLFPVRRLWIFHAEAGLSGERMWATVVDDVRRPVERRVEFAHEDEAVAGLRLFIRTGSLGDC